MGKAKKRSLHLGINDRITNLSREDAILEVVKLLNSKICDNQRVYELITLFGMFAEELLEAGATYESVMSLQGIVKA